MFEYDFFINKNNRFVIPELDINYLYSPSESNVPNIPEASETSVKIAGKDGDIVLDTKYEPMQFELVVYADENLTPDEKTLEINKITTFLNSIKNKYKKIAFLQGEKMYSVKYNKQLTITNFPKSIKFQIPLKSSKSYGTDLYMKKILGNGIKISNTIESTGCIITIEGHCQLPKISLNNYQMEYDNVILEGNKLIIDTGNSTVTHITSQGVKTNASIYYNHEYPKIKPGKNEIIIISGVDDASQVTTKWYDLKL